jgi:hypothetical protein
VGLNYMSLETFCVLAENLTELLRKCSWCTHWHRVATTRHVEHLSTLDEIIDRTVDLWICVLASSLSTAKYICSPKGRMRQSFHCWDARM